MIVANSTGHKGCL